MIGTKWRHLKRGTTYEIVGRSTYHLEGSGEPDPVDGCDAWLVVIAEWGSYITANADARLDRGVFVSLPVTLQVSGNYAEVDDVDFAVYTAGDGKMWARPIAEFTPDRFERIDA